MQGSDVGGGLEIVDAFSRPVAAIPRKVSFGRTVSESSYERPTTPVTPEEVAMQSKLIQDRMRRVQGVVLLVLLGVVLLVLLGVVLLVLLGVVLLLLLGVVLLVLLGVVLLVAMLRDTGCGVECEVLANLGFDQA